MTARRFPPPPWSVEEQSACFVVRDHNGQVLAHVYFERRRNPQAIRAPARGSPTVIITTTLDDVTTGPVDRLCLAKLGPPTDLLPGQVHHFAVAGPELSRVAATGRSVPA
jgi:hypothetical protein